MSKISEKELLDLDLYEILNISCEASEKEIKQSFRKKALLCHPDKNPDDPNAAQEFHKLKKILEILLDPGAKSAYDRVLKGRKAAAVRARERNLKNQKLKDDLDEREKLSTKGLHISEEERLKREIKRLEEEGKKIIEEELELLNQEAGQQIRVSSNNSHVPPPPVSPASCRVKAKWRTSSDGSTYSKEDITRLFYKWGEINAVVLKDKGEKSTALIEFKNGSSADMAVQFEKGIPDRPMEVSFCSSTLDKKKKKKKKNKHPESDEGKRPTASRDFESIAEMNRRREAERKRLIQEMLMEDRLS